MYQKHNKIFDNSNKLEMLIDKEQPSTSAITIDTTPVKTKCNFEELGDEFDIMYEIGRGSYGVVFKATKKNDNERRKYAVKRIFPIINSHYILMEILFLNLLEGRNNIIELVEGRRLLDQTSLIFVYKKNKPFLTFFEDFSMLQIKIYMYQLLRSVAYLDSYGIMHRDIKPSNFLYDPVAMEGVLIDFGLSEVETDINFKPLKHENNPIVRKLAVLQKQLNIKNRTGTKGYLAPETILGHKNQNSGVDVWSCGVIFLSFLTKRHPIFNLNQGSKIKNFILQCLTPMICIFGTDEISKVAFSLGYGIHFPQGLKLEKVDWRLLCSKRDDVSDSAISLLNRLLALDRKERITAEQALNHEFFDEVREKLINHQSPQATKDISQSEPMDYL